MGSEDITLLFKLPLTILKTNQGARIRQLLSNNYQAAVFPRVFASPLRQHRQLQCEHGGSRSGDREQPLGDSCDKIALIVHVNLR
jgi:hypothetical protein